MTQEDKKLLLTDLCARLPYGVMVETYWEFKNKKEKTFPKTTLTYRMLGYYIGEEKWNYNTHFLPFLRPMSNMTNEEAMEVAELWGLEDILSISVKENYISVELCDGVAMSETYTIWFNEIVASIKLFDWLNEHHFDYRGLIEKGLALPATKEMYKD